VSENEVLLAVIAAWTIVRLTTLALSHSRARNAAADKKAAGR
jgi:hypothetical protein